MRAAVKEKVIASDPAEGAVLPRRRKAEAAMRQQSDAVAADVERRVDAWSTRVADWER